VATASPIELDAAEPYAEAAARTISVRADELIEHSGHVLDTSDIEHVHDMRVATRRLRAALEVFEPCFPRKKFRRVLRDVKRLADALGERRDRDVTIKALRGFGAEMAGADRSGIDVLTEKLRAEQRQANAELEPLVTREAVSELRLRLASLAETAR